MNNNIDLNNTNELVVSTLEDENDGDYSQGDLSLREAIALSNEREGADTITFGDSLNNGTITLNSSQGQDLNIDDSLSIFGLGQDNLTLNGGFVLKVAADNDAVIDGLNFEGGTVDNSGNLTFSNSQIRETQNIGGSSDFYALISRENVNIVNSSIRDNVGGDNVGIVIASGTATIEGSTIANNSGVLGAAGIIINSDAAADISNSTIVNNGSRSGGGVANAGIVDISNSTIVNNQGGRTAGGIINRGNATVTSSIVANNTGNDGTFAVGDVFNITDDAMFTSGGNNLIGNGDDASGFVDGVNGDIVGSDGDDPLNRQLDLLIDPNLGELQNNGGLTDTLALLEDSPAIDAGSNPNGLETDQRGEGFDRTVGNATDIGAYEVQDIGGEIPTEFVVSTLEDENDGDFSQGELSLREAIALANEQEGADTITFDNSLNGGSIVSNTSLQRDLIISDSLSINGLGQDNITLDGGFILTNRANVDLDIDGLNLTGGKIDSFGNLTLSNSTISETIAVGGSSDNSSIIGRGTTNISDSSIVDSNGGGALGIVIESGTANIERSTIANHGQGVTGGAGVLIRTDETVNINNSTIANNSNTKGSAGLSVSGTVNVSNSTIVNNSGGVGSGGIINTNGDVVNLTSSIVAGNTGAGDGRPVEDINGEFVSGGNNIIGNGDDTSGFIDSDLVGTLENRIDPKLGELKDNGGLTQTIALLEDSPAIDAGSNPNGLETDQRGAGFDRTVGNGTDIGAYEVQDSGVVIPTELVVSTLEDESDGDFSAGDLSLREAIALAENDENIMFDSDLSGGSIVLSQGELLIDKSISIDGLGANNLTIDGNNSLRIFLIDDGNDDTQANVSIGGLTLKDGNSLNSSIDYLDGGGFLNRENLTVTDSALIGNRAGNGGAIYNTGSLLLENSLVSQSGGTGPVSNDGGVASIFNSTFANNGVAGVSAIVNNNAGTLDLANSTITGNSGYGAALFNSEDSTATVSSTIVAGNLAELPEEEGKDDILGNYISNGNNLIGNTNGGSGFNDPSDLVGTVDNPLNPRLGELQDNGGLTQTIALLENSPAIDAGSNPNGLETDQRGAGFDRTIGNGTDIGAFEVQTIGATTIIGTPGNDFLLGTEQSDTIEGLDGNDTLNGLNGADILLGDNGDDSLDGGARNDSLDGGAGADTLLGGNGQDTLDGGMGNDLLQAGASDDLLLGQDGNDTLLGDPGRDTLNGGFGNDSLYGGTSDDLLLGFDGNDTLDGGNGRDTLDGGMGNDLITGGNSNDTFVLSSGTGTDIITDFGLGNNAIALTGGIAYEDLTFSGNNIMFETETLASLNGFDTTSLTESDFVIL